MKTSIEPLHKKKEKGQSLAELAISLTFMLILLAGVVELGRAFFAYIAIRDAAQEGALYGSVCPGDTSGIIIRVQEASNLLDLSSGDVTVTTTGSGEAGDGIKVAIVYRFPVAMPFLGTIIGGQTINMSTSVTDTILAEGIAAACP